MPTVIFSHSAKLAFFFVIFQLLISAALACDQGLYLRSDWMTGTLPAARVSHKEIYHDIYVQLRGVIGGGLGKDVKSPKFSDQKLQDKKFQDRLKTLRHHFPRARIHGWLSWRVDKDFKFVSAIEQIIRVARQKFDFIHLDFEPIDSGDQRLIGLLKTLRSMNAEFRGSQSDRSDVNKSGINEYESNLFESVRPGFTEKSNLAPPQPDQFKNQLSRKFKISLAAMPLKIDGDIGIHPRPERGAQVFAWTPEYYQQILPLVDQIMVMNYDTALRDSKEYSEFTAWQTSHLSSLVLSAGDAGNAKNARNASEDQPGKAAQVELRIGVPVYAQGRPGVFDSRVENLRSTLAGVKRVWSRCPTSAGLAVFIEDEFTLSDQGFFQKEWPAKESGWMWGR